MKQKMFRMWAFCIGIIFMGGFLSGGARAEAAKKFDPSGKYHAALGLETDSTESVHRDAYFEKKYLKDPSREHLVIGNNGEIGYQIMKGAFTNVTLKGNGTYTVSLKDADFNGNRSFRKLYVATDIPNARGVTLKNVTVTINGTKYYTFEDAVLDDSAEHGKNCVMLVLDKSNPEVSNVFARSSVPVTQENEITISFQIKGFSYKKGGVPPTPTPIPTPTPEISEMETVASVVPAVEGGTGQTVKIIEKEVVFQVPMANKIGIACTVAVAILGIILCAVAVSRRQH